LKKILRTVIEKMAQYNNKGNCGRCNSGCNGNCCGQKCCQKNGQNNSFYNPYDRGYGGIQSTRTFDSFNGSYGDVGHRCSGGCTNPCNLCPAPCPTPGPPGPPGSVGSTGSTGSTGATGATGQTGATGASGISGTPGVSGPSGIQGPPGSSASISYVDISRSFFNSAAEYKGYVALSCSISSFTALITNSNKILNSCIIGVLDILPGDNGGEIHIYSGTSFNFYINITYQTLFLIFNTTIADTYLGVITNSSNLWSLDPTVNSVRVFYGSN